MFAHPRRILQSPCVSTRFLALSLWKENGTTQTHPRTRSPKEQGRGPWESDHQALVVRMFATQHY